MLWRSAGCCGHGHQRPHQVRPTALNRWSTLGPCCCSGCSCCCHGYRCNRHNDSNKDCCYCCCHRACCCCHGCCCCCLSIMRLSSCGPNFRFLCSTLVLTCLVPCVSLLLHAHLKHCPSPTSQVSRHACITSSNILTRQVLVHASMHA